MVNEETEVVPEKDAVVSGPQALKVISSMARSFP